MSDVNNPLRGIFGSLATRRTYFENMSRAFATLCDTKALLMTDNINDVKLDGIWGKVELLTLQMTGNKGGMVNVVSNHL